MLGDVPYSQVQRMLSSYSYIYSGTPKSIDKALLEGAAAGCLVLSENPGANELTGMNTILTNFGIYNDSSLAERLMLLQALDSNVTENLRLLIADKTRQTCDISKTSFKIAEILNEV